MNTILLVRKEESPALQQQAADQVGHEKEEHLGPEKLMSLELLSVARWGENRTATAM